MMRWSMLVLVTLGCGGRPVPATVADGCYEVAHAACAKDIACTTGAGGSDCINTAQKTCCAAHDCTEPVSDCKAGLRECAGGPMGSTSFSAHVFWNCEDALQAETCGQWAGGLVPTACAGGVDGGM